MVLVDNKPRLNACPLKVTSYLSLGPKNFALIGRTMKACDNSKRRVIRIVSIDVTISLAQFVVEFQVLDEIFNFNLLVRRHQIHQVIVIPSTLYQKIKFPYEHTIIIVHRDSGKGIVTSLLILEVQHTKEDPFLYEFRYNKVQTITLVEPKEERFKLNYDPFVKSCVAIVMKNISFLPLLVLRKRQQRIP